MAGKLKVTLVKSTIRTRQRVKDTVDALGMRRLHSCVELPDNPSVRGMLAAAGHLVKVEEI